MFKRDMHDCTLGEREDQVVFRFLEKDFVPSKNEGLPALEAGKSILSEFYLYLKAYRKEKTPWIAAFRSS